VDDVRHRLAADDRLRADRVEARAVEQPRPVVAGASRREHVSRETAAQLTQMARRREKERARRQPEKLAPVHASPEKASNVSTGRFRRTRRRSRRVLVSAPRAAPLALAVDDPAAAEVVRRDLDLHAVARIDADPVAAHLAGGVAEGLVAVVERDLVHAVAEGLDDLTLELDLLLFPCHVTSFRTRVRPARADGADASPND